VFGSLLTARKNPPPDEPDAVRGLSDLLNGLVQKYILRYVPTPFVNLNKLTIGFLVSRNWRKIHYCSACESDAIPSDLPGKLRCPKECGAPIRYHLVRRLPQLLLELLGALAW
jgi:hypothetical protein